MRPISTEEKISVATEDAKSAQVCPDDCRLTCTRGYQGLVSPRLNQYHNRAFPCGTRTQVGLPRAPARCAVVLLTVTTTSQAEISAASPSMSRILSISSR